MYNYDLPCIDSCHDLVGKISCRYSLSDRVKCIECLHSSDDVIISLLKLSDRRKVQTVSKSKQKFPLYKDSW